MSLADDLFYNQVIQDVMKRRRRRTKLGHSEISLAALHSIKEGWKQHLEVLRSQNPPQKQPSPEKEEVSDNIDILMNTLKISSSEDEEEETETSKATGADRPPKKQRTCEFPPATISTAAIAIAIGPSSHENDDESLHPSVERKILDELDMVADDEADEAVTVADAVDREYEDLIMRPFDSEDDKGQEDYCNIWTEVAAKEFENTICALYSLFKRFIRRNRTAWYFILKYGVITVGNKELLFSRAEGRIEFN